MKKFEVCIRGENFLIKRGRTVKKNGFLAARFVEARDYSSAVEEAMKLLRADLKDMVVNDKSDPPRLKVMEINEVYYFGDKIEVGDKVLTGEGFLWDEPWEEESRQEIIKAKLQSLLEWVREKDFHIHSMAIHFTNGLYPVALLFLFLYLFTKRPSFHDTYFYLIFLATVSVPVSYITGIIEWKRRYQKAMVPIFLVKIKLGVVVFITGTLCTLLDYFYLPLTDGKILTPVFVLLNLLILPLIVYLGYIGGVIVYRGVEQVQSYK